MKLQHVPMPPPRAKKLSVPPTLRRAADDYKEAYKDVFGVTPQITYDGTWVRVQGSEGGVSTRRLRELTTQLRNRKG